MLTRPLFRGGRAAARAESHRAAPRLRPTLDPLESRGLLSTVGAPSAYSTLGVEPTAEEQYMLQLVNRARANPAAEAQRLVSLAQSDPTLRPALSGWSASAFLQEMGRHGPAAPLAFNPRLIAAARVHDAAMVALNAQVHTDLSTLVQPATAAQLAPDGQPYYPVSGSSWSLAENIFAYSSNLPDSHGKPLVDYFEAAFLLDWGNPDFGHLKNLLSPGPSGGGGASYPMNEVGIGLITDQRPSAAPGANPAYASNAGLNVGPALVTQDFGFRSGHQFLEGAVYADRNGDGFYTPGEGLGGVTITVVGLHGEGTFSVQNWGSGGYALDLPQGSYTVTASGGALTSPRITTLSIGADNVAWDVTNSPASTTPPVTTSPPAPAGNTSPTPTPNPAGPGRVLATVPPASAPTQTVPGKKHKPAKHVRHPKPPKFRRAAAQTAAHRASLDH